MDSVLSTALPLLLGLGSVILLPVGLRLLARNLRFGWAATERATATVVGHEAEGGADGYHYYPIVTFTAEGASWRVKGRWGYLRSSPYQVGQVVPVYYAPGAPGQARLQRFEACWTTFGLAVVGGASSLSGLPGLWAGCVYCPEGGQSQGDIHHLSVLIA
jgi:hypothetical protein